MASSRKPSPPFLETLIERGARKIPNPTRSTGNPNPNHPIRERMNTEGLSIICTGLGFAGDDGYIKSDYCLDNLKDLQRFLRRDDPQRRDVFKQLCKWNTVSLDLIPIIEQYQSDRNLVINAVKVLVFLTMPIDPASDDVSQQMEYLWDLKAAMTRNVTIAIIVEVLEDPLDHLEHDTFTEDDWNLVQLVLTLFRNILAIQGFSLQQKAGGSATYFLCLRDRFLELMFQENVMDLILVLTQHIDDSSGYLRQDNLLLLEIFHYIFLGQDPSMIAKTSSSKVDGDIVPSVDSLRSMMVEEEEKRRIMTLWSLERHSQFSGTFTRLAMDGSKTLFKGNPAAASGHGLLKAHKVQRGRLKRIAWDHENISLPKDNILELLKNFLDQFLTGGYNVLMQSIYDDIRKELQAIQNSDVMLFFQVADFVISFQHQNVSVAKKSTMEGTTPEVSLEHGDNLSFNGDFCGPIAATMNDAVFCLVISRLREAFDCLKESNDHKFLYAAVSLLKNMIRMLYLVLKLLPEDSKEPQTARILLYKILYDQTDQGLTQFLLNLFKSFDNHKQPKSYLADLLETIHIVLSLTEKLQARGTLRVSRKSRKTGKRRITKHENNVEAESQRQENASSPNADSRAHEAEMPTESIVDSNKSTEEHLHESGSAGIDAEDDCMLISDSIMQPAIHSEEAENLRDGLSHGDIDKVSNNLSPTVEPAMPPQDTVQLANDSAPVDSRAHVAEIPTESIVDSNKSTEEHLHEPGSAGIDAEDGCMLISDPIMQPAIHSEETENLRDGLSHGDIDKVSNNLSSTAEPAMPPQDTVQVANDSAPVDGDELNNNHIDLAYETEDPSDDEQPPPVNEVDFDSSMLVASFANNAVIQNLCWLLKYYRSNSNSTNHYVICMLQRICDDLELSPLLYQLSVLTTFYDILSDQKSVKEYASIRYFLTKFIRKMLKIIKKQPLLFVEILFWKTRKECHYINADALMCDLVKMKKDIRSLYSEGVDLSNNNGGPGPKSIGDSLGDDEADLVIPNDLNNREGTLSEGAHKKYFHTTKRRGSKRNMMTSFGGNETDEDKSEGILLDNETQKASKRKGHVFDQEQETAVKNLFEKYKYDRQCSRLIAQALDPDGKISPLQVTGKLRKLGLKVVSRKKFVSAGEPSPLGDDSTGTKDNAFTSTAILSSSKKADDNLFPGTSSHTRKRIQAFSKEQELEVKSLFERFKNHKKCSLMIANALEADKTHTAAQVSRKLKQLGLLLPRRRKSSINAEHGKEEEVIDINKHPGEETLLEIKERSKRKKSKRSVEGAMTSISHNEVASSGDRDSDEEILSTRSKRLKSKNSVEVAMTSISHNEVTSSADRDSDDEILSTMFKSKRKKSNLPRKESATVLAQRGITSAEDNDSDNETLITKLKKKSKVSATISAQRGITSAEDHDSDNETLSTKFKNQGSGPLRTGGSIDLDGEIEADLNLGDGVQDERVAVFSNEGSREEFATISAQRGITSAEDHDSDNETLSTKFKNQGSGPLRTGGSIDLDGEIEAVLNLGDGVQDERVAVFSNEASREESATISAQRGITLAEDHDSDNETSSTKFKNQGSAPLTTSGSIDLDGKIEADLNLGDGVQDERVAVFSNEASREEQQTKDDVLQDLVDSGDEMGLIVPGNVGYKRNLKMVIDAADDDE